MGIETAAEAMKIAKNWLLTAETMADKKIYNTALYSEEMAVEIALKALLLSFRVEPPKMHNIIEIVDSKIINSEKLSKEKREEIREITRYLLPELLVNRQVSGYTFNYNIDKKDLETLALKYLDLTRNAVKLCNNIIEENL
jgi:HEPN domain-containing protein